MLGIEQSLYTMMIAHLQAAYPLEACGLLGGKDGRIQRLYPIDNILQSPTAYEMDPLQQVRAMIEIEDQGLEVTAIYHSHPHGPARPSLTDVALAYYPDPVYLIVSLENRERPQVGAFTIVNKQVTEVSWRIEQL